MLTTMNTRSPNIANNPPAIYKGKWSDDKSKNAEGQKLSKPLSATNGRNNVTPLKDLCCGNEMTQGASLPKMQTNNCYYRKNNNNLQAPISRVNECEEQQPQEENGLDLGKEDNESQVFATDIQVTVGSQSSYTVVPETSELPQRRSNRVRALAPHRQPHSCDCERPLPVSAKQHLHNATQTEPWQVSSLEFSQTGPSLTAVGPFSRFDYKLKKTQLAKDDTFFNCCPTDRPRDTITFSNKWFLCTNVNQQVSPLDINVSELLQTEEPTEIGERNGRVMCGSCLRQRPRIGCKDQNIVDCECSLRDRRPADMDSRGFSAQVAQEELSPTKCTQTDLCLWLDVCRKSRLYPCGYWICGLTDMCRSLPRKLPRNSVKDFSQQVTATDIGDTKETQTCLHLMLAKPFCFTCSHLAVQRCGPVVTNHRLLTGRAGSFRTDGCVACSTTPKVRTVLNASTQVKHDDTGMSREQQTCDPTPKLTNCFIRRGEWASKTWH